MACQCYSSHYIHKAKEVGPQTTKGVGSKHKGVGSPGMQGGRVLGCKGVGIQDAKVTVLQANLVGSWRWPCGSVHRY